MDWLQNGPFAVIEGMIVDMNAARAGEGSLDGCNLYFTVEDDDGNIAVFLVTKDTCVIDGVTLKEGMRAGFWYRTDAPIPLIYPPQYYAVVAAQMRGDRMINVSHYDDSLVNAEQTLQILLDWSVEMRTANHQIFLGSPAERDLAVVYTTSTRSIPAQTTPTQVVVLCDDGEQGCFSPDCYPQA